MCGYECVTQCFVPDSDSVVPCEFVPDPVLKCGRVLLEFYRSPNYQTLGDLRGNDTQYNNCNYGTMLGSSPSAPSLFLPAILPGEEFLPYSLEVGVEVVQEGHFGTRVGAGTEILKR